MCVYATRRPPVHCCCSADLSASDPRSAANVAAFHQIRSSSYFKTNPSHKLADSSSPAQTLGKSPNIVNYLAPGTTAQPPRPRAREQEAEQAREGP